METIEHKTIKVNGINMHVATKGGHGPIVLFIHGFPELWYSWRHQIHAVASLGYRAVAPDLRGYGDSDGPPSPSSYTTLSVVGDLIALLDAIAGPSEKAFVVGHDWGAIIAWYLCLYRPDRVRALVNMSVPFTPRKPGRKPLDTYRAIYGDDYYICRFQFLTYRTPGPLFLTKGNLFGHPEDKPIELPAWLCEEDVEYYTSKYEKTGFRGGFNYYPAMDLNWELTAPWTGAQIKVPTKFIVGDLDLTYNTFGAKEYLQSGRMKKVVPLLEEIVVMEDVGHFIQMEKPDEINAHILSFFQRF